MFVQYISKSNKSRFNAHILRSDLQLRNFLRALQSYITKKTFYSDYRLRSNEKQDNSLEKVT